ncbi:hypothetical protein TVAG_114460 [Trichomonas vaginalis G3]|uniref:Serine-threonine kinase receptor-associated protein n=1 Tax=Trichomonas vaginalis (strain ATCC PRA-98 / G3) TaxID=412133 RepID=A2FAR5_TRIV3|nr:translation initiation factor protein [Trichomonas vaginalis G3]EAX97994.1 hypothetical protein TVAG_114460 [Trichomonas vaginalis G3]KAI5521899.1 translation initiation factor protein [Trichomonas vaginalis G3]|eukprot:XP_001310924.1 hypothetical protein [Trichomonas vaginalis G3]
MEPDQEALDIEYPLKVIDEIRGSQTESVLFTPGERACTHACLDSTGHLAFVVSDKDVYGYFIPFGTNFKIYSGHDGAITDIDIEPENKIIATVGNSMHIIFHEVETGNILLDELTDKMHAACCFGPRNMHFFATVTSKQMKQEIVLTGYHFVEKRGKDDYPIDMSNVMFKYKFDCVVNSIRWPKADMILAGDVQGKVHVLTGLNNDVPNVQIIDAHRGPINAITMSFDNNFFATASADTTARLWKIPQKEIDQFELIGTYNHSFQISCAAISPKEPVIVLASTADHSEVARINSGSTDFTINFFHTIFQEEFASMKVHKSPINWVAFTSDGFSLITTSAEGTFQVIHLCGDYAESIIEQRRKMKEIEAITD